MASGKVMNETSPGGAKKVSYPSKSKGVKKFAEGGAVRQMPPGVRDMLKENPGVAETMGYKENPAGIPTVRGALPKKARALWDRIPNVKEFARTGKVFPSSEDVDRAERRENAYETNKRK